MIYVDIKKTRLELLENNSEKYLEGLKRDANKYLMNLDLNIARKEINEALSSLTFYQHNKDKFISSGGKIKEFSELEKKAEVLQNELNNLRLKK